MHVIKAYTYVRIKVDSIFQGFIFQGFSSTSAPIDSKEAIHDLLEKVSLVWSRLKLIHRDVQNARRNCIIEYVQYPIIPPANAQSNLKEEENMNDSPSPTSVSPQFGIKTTFYHCKARMRLNTIFWVSFASSNIKDCGLVYPFSTRVPITTWTDCCNESSTTSSIS